MWAARRKVVEACDHSMPRRGHGRTGDSMYWWNDQLSVLRRKCLTFVLLTKGNKPLGDASSYRPICLLDTMGKLLDEMILQRLQGHMVGENGLSENQFGFRKGRSTVDAI